MTEEQMKVAHESLIRIAKEMSAIALERNVKLHITDDGLYMNYPNRLWEKTQSYRFDELTPLAMVSSVAGKPLLLRTIEQGTEKFVQPYIEFEGTEPTMDSVFISLNESLNKFVEENPCADMKVAWRYAPSPTLNQRPDEIPYALLSNLYLNGAFTDVNFSRDVLFYFVLQNRMKYELKTRVRPGGDSEYQYYGMHSESHDEFYGAFRKLLNSVRSDINSIEFKSKYEVEPKSVGEK